MRPIELKISAFGAYAKKQVINFDEGLAGSNLFLIHGPTGAGKTTILDAIIFALYGSKNFGNDRDPKMMRSEYADDSTPTEIEFKFALGDKIYRVKRSYLSDLKKSTAELDNGEYLITKNVSDKIEELIGFQSEQFRQVILLQQGAFKKFLIANTDARQKILDKLFNAGFYKLIEDNLDKKSKTLDNELKNINDQCDSKLADVEAKDENDLTIIIDQTAKELEESQSQDQILSKQQEIAQNELVDGRAIFKQFIELENVIKKLESAKKSLIETQVALKSAKVSYDENKSLEEERKRLEKQIEDLKKIYSQLNELDQAEKKLSAAKIDKDQSELMIANCNSSLNAFDVRMEELRVEKEGYIKGAENLKFYQTKIKENEQREKTIKDIELLKKQLAEAEKNCSIIESQRIEQQQKVDRLKQLSILGRAALLAKDLKDGEPCPVCGSIDHPKLAISKEIIPTDKEIKLAEDELNKIVNRKSQADNLVADKKARLQTLIESLDRQSETANVNDLKQKLSQAENAKSKCEEIDKKRRKGELSIKEVKELMATNEQKRRSAADEVSKITGKINEIKKQILEEYQAEDGIAKVAKDIKITREKLQALNEAWEIAEKTYHGLEKQEASDKSTVAAAEENHKKLTEELTGKTKPNIEELQKRSNELTAAWKLQNQKTADLKSKSERLANVNKFLKEMTAKIAILQKESDLWYRLSRVANGHNPRKMKFQTYILNSAFQEIIAEANARLESMSSGRYKFKYKMPDIVNKLKFQGLDFEIFDEFTGTTRPVATLSGGESFLASLSLALGLADVVQNNAGGIKLDTIFIDEGFGSLDSDTLDQTLKTLNELQKDGRLVGIISHVEELKQQIHSKLEIVKSKNGSYAKFIN